MLVSICDTSTAKEQIFTHHHLFFTMKNRINQWFSRGALATATLLAMAACSDDHFDIQNNFGSDKTLWENIESAPELSDFAGILKRTKVLKDENDRKATLFASDLINQPQSFTMWAPLNGTFNAKMWNDSLDAAERYAALGTEEGRIRAVDLYYNVWNQLVSNHIARYNHEGYTGNKEVKMLNLKNATYTGTTFNGVPTEGSALVASNGSLHLLKGASPFAYNIYDYLSFDKNFSAINAYLKDKSINEVTFSEGRSTPGALNEEGNMVYIDSAFNRRNEVLDRAGALVRNEDSTYVALIPTDAAWKEALEKISKIYKFGSRYAYEWSGSSFNRNTPTTQYRLDHALHADASKTQADSLQDYNAKLHIALNMFFAPYRMKNVNAKDSAALNNYVNRADSLISTYRVVFHNQAAQKSAPDGTANPVLAGLQPYRASNGYIYRLPSYKIDPAYSFVKELDIPLRYTNDNYLLTASNLRSASGKGTLVRLEEGNYNRYRVLVEEKDDKIDTVRNEQGEPVMVGVQGDIPDNVYYRYQIDNVSSAMEITFRLPRVHSTKYEVELVMLPSKVDLDYPDAEDERVRFTAKVLDDENNEFLFTDNDGAAKKEVTIDQDQMGADGKPMFDQSKVNTIKLGKFIEFSKSYEGLPNNIDAFPRLVLRLPAKSRRDPKIRCSALNIIAIKLKPYRGE